MARQKSPRGVLYGRGGQYVFQNEPPGAKRPRGIRLFCVLFVSIHSDVYGKMSGLNSIYEQAFKRRKKESDWGSLLPPPREDKQGGGAGKPSTEKKGKGPAKRLYPTPSFSLTKVKGPSGRASYEIRQKLQVLDFSRLRCQDGQEVGKRGAATVFGISVRRLRSWEEQESDFRKSLGAAAYHAGLTRSLNNGRSSPTAEVEDAIVHEIINLGNKAWP